MIECIQTSETTSTVNSNKDQEQVGKEDTLEIVPPYPNEIESFDNPETYPDLEFVVAGMEKPLHLHRKILAKVSGCFKTMLKEKRDLRLEWPYDTNREVDRDGLVKALRFCYGETLNIGTNKGECCTMIATLTRLQVTCLGDVATKLINFAIDEAKRNLETAVELLKICIDYKECCGTSHLSLDKKLAAIVLTKDNMHDHYKEVVDDCLMVLPADYLMLAHYGEPHTRCSEFCMRTKYVRCHSKMNKEEKQSLVVKCDWSTLNSQELQELRLADIIDKEELLDAYEKALVYCEIKNEQTQKMMEQAEKKADEKVKELEKEKEQESERAKKAEREAEELRKRTEKADEEKEKKVKELEMDRDKWAKEAEKNQRRAEKAEKEREEESKRARKAEVDREEFRKRTEQAENEKKEMEKKVNEAELEQEVRGKEKEEYKKWAVKAEREKTHCWNHAETLNSFLRGNRLYSLQSFMNNQIWLIHESLKQTT